MTDSSPPGEARAADPTPRSAGALLKAAREREGLHLAVLAATIKVSPAKLQALERDQYDQLPNATFTRALAQSVCRSLKIDPRPVLALLPQIEALPLEGGGARLNTPFQDRPGRSDSASLAWASKPMFWAGGLLLLAALAVGFVPASMVESLTAQVGGFIAPAPGRVSAAAPAVEPAVSARVSASAPELSSAASAARSDPVASAPPAQSAEVASAAPPAAASSTPSVANASSPAVAGGLLRLAASADSWIEVLDAQGQQVFSRILARGEAVAVDAPPPLKVRVGNASGTSVAFRGQAFDLTPYTRDNVARVELR
jgi:cytoskeleton protein RodZ